MLARALAEHLPEWTPHPCKGGWSMWVKLPGDSADAFAAAALHHGVAVGSGTSTSPDEDHLDHLRLCFSAPPDLLVDAVERLAAAWEARPLRRVASLVP